MHQHAGARVRAHQQDLHALHHGRGTGTTAVASSERRQEVVCYDTLDTLASFPDEECEQTVRLEDNERKGLPPHAHAHAAAAVATPA